MALVIASSEPPEPPSIPFERGMAGSAFACSSRWIRPCFSSRRGSIPQWNDRVPACPSSPPQGAFLSDRSPSGSKTMRSTPQRNNSGPAFQSCFRTPFGALILRPGTLLEIRAEVPLSAARRAGGVIRSGALVGAPGGTQTHSRRTGRKLGRLRYARQGLVRVPESNTKYGGRRGKTGVGAAPVIEPSISESWEIPKRKNSLPGCGFRLRPAVHRAAIFSRPGIAFGGLT
jgi:hypothetical protein